MNKALFACGCFWGVQQNFEKLPGVISTLCGYSGGNRDNPSYEQVCAGDTGHAETVLIEYDPEKISYRDLLSAFWKMHDPSDPHYACDIKGGQYRSAIFYFDDDQEKLAKTSKEREQTKTEKQIVTQILPAALFYPAENYHQHYYRKKEY